MSDSWKDAYKVGVEEFDEKFEFLIGDMDWEDHGGKWFRRVSRTCFQVVEIFKWEEAVGEAEAEDMPTYHVDLTEVDVSIDSKSAMGYSGLEFDEKGNIVGGAMDIVAEHDDEEKKQIVICECMHSAGSKAYLGQWDGDDYEELFKLAFADAESYADHGDAYEEKMESPGNAIGSTVREMQRGDFKSAMLRGIARGDENARILGIMHYGRDNVEEIEKAIKVIK